MLLKLAKTLAAAVVTLCLMAVGGLWTASSQILSPSFQGITKDLSQCPPQAAAAWGEGCGNLRTTHALNFTEVRIPSLNGFDLPGWLVLAQDNGAGPSRGAILLAHGGGSDRREETRHIRFLLAQGLDVLTFDLGCHGEAPCPVPGMSYAHRESRDVLSAYLFLSERYQKVYAMGGSVGAAAILVALPGMPGLQGVIAENPMFNFQRLLLESPAAPAGIPDWFSHALLDLVMLRGRFDGELSPANALRVVKRTPILFMHSKADMVVPVRQTQELADIYQGPKSVWFPDKGDHSALREADTAQFETRLAAFLKQQE